MLKFFTRLLNNEKGFTLIEVLVVVAIIGILIALAAPRVLTRLEDARIASDQAVAKVLNDAIVTIELDNAVNPRGPGWDTGDIQWSELEPYLEDSSGLTNNADGSAIGGTTKVDGLVIKGSSTNMVIKAYAPGGSEEDANGDTVENTSDVFKFFLIEPAAAPAP